MATGAVSASAEVVSGAVGRTNLPITFTGFEKRYCRAEAGDCKGLNTQFQLAGRTASSNGNNE